MIIVILLGNWVEQWRDLYFLDSQTLRGSILKYKQNIMNKRYTTGGYAELKRVEHMAGLDVLKRILLALVLSTILSQRNEA